MEVNYSKKGSKWHIVFSVENIDPSGLAIAGNFNGWDSHSVKYRFASGSKELKVTMPADAAFLSFKVYDPAHNAWCEVYDNGELYVSLEPYFVSNEMGTINVTIPLVDVPVVKVQGKKSPVKKEAAVKAAPNSTKTTTRKTSIKK